MPALIKDFSEAQQMREENLLKMLLCLKAQTHRVRWWEVAFLLRLQCNSKSHQVCDKGKACASSVPNASSDIWTSQYNENELLMFQKTI